MLITTTTSLDGHKIKEYRGVVFGEVISGINFMRDFTASIHDTLGGRSDDYEAELVESRAAAIAEITKRAEKIGANAIIGLSIDYETIGQRGSMLMVVASGTAVVLD